MKSLFSKLLKPTTKYDFSNKSYSQDGEDMILRSFYDDIGGKANGFFVDIGALHPQRFSNTAYFYNLGWKGINIEPTPSAIDLFNTYRTRDINLNIGIAEEASELTFYCFDEPALNSFSKDLSEERANNTRYNIIDKKRIPVYPLKDILDKHLPIGQNIDFMSIDVEGLDFQVLKSNNWDKYKPEIILAEDPINLDNLSSSKVYQFLVNKGYELFAKTSRTLIFKVID